MIFLYCGLSYLAGAATIVGLLLVLDIEILHEDTLKRIRRH